MLLKRGVDGSALKPDVILERNVFFLVCEVRGRNSHEKKRPSVAPSLRLRYPPDFFLSACTRSPRNMIKKDAGLASVTAFPLQFKMLKWIYG